MYMCRAWKQPRILSSSPNTRREGGEGWQGPRGFRCRSCLPATFREQAMQLRGRRRRRKGLSTNQIVIEHIQADRGRRGVVLQSPYTPSGGPRTALRLANASCSAVPTSGSHSCSYECNNIYLETVQPPPLLKQTLSWEWTVLQAEPDPKVKDRRWRLWRIAPSVSPHMLQWGWSAGLVGSGLDSQAALTSLFLCRCQHLIKGSNSEEKCACASPMWTQSQANNTYLRFEQCTKTSVSGTKRPASLKVFAVVRNL